MPESNAEFFIVKLNFESGVFKDSHESDPKRRYKMFGRIDRPERHMAVAFSEDGVDWSAPYTWPEHNVQGDAHNNAIWSPILNRYVGITRIWHDRQRIAVRTESENFINWTKPEEVLRGKGIHEQIYSMPIFYYANVYIGLPSVLNEDDTVDTELAWSPDTRIWYRISPGTAFIPRGKNLSDYPYSDYDAGCIYASVPVIKKDEILIYYGGSNHFHTDWREGSWNLARLRPDGFAGYMTTGNSVTGRIKTNLFCVAGSDFRISADIGQQGFMKLAVLDETGIPVPGYTLEESRVITGNNTDTAVKWNGKGLAALKGEKVAFEFMFKDAVVYSLSGNVNFN